MDCLSNLGAVIYFTIITISFPLNTKTCIYLLIDKIFYVKFIFNEGSVSAMRESGGVGGKSLQAVLLGAVQTD